MLAESSAFRKLVFGHRVLLRLFNSVLEVGPTGYGNCRPDEEIIILNYVPRTGDEIRTVPDDPASTPGDTHGEVHALIRLGLQQPRSRRPCPYVSPVLA